ncbi:MAG: 3-deoxy-7-phosphoheptulonate synthase [Clostridia bacterium]|nr:3-deoxy-7-phosphoheptulonate synthase [Clostridia bacterium]
MGMNFHHKLPIPKYIKAQYPVTDEMAKTKAERDEEIRRVFRGESEKLLLVIGPCSADHKQSVMEYLGRLRTVQDKVKDSIFIIPRVYTNKPRTTGDGYKGMLHQPNPTEKPDMLHGIVAIRDLHMSALREYGFSCADEMLYPDNYRYLSDLLSYVAVGARSVENQQHRLTSSGLDSPVVMKNPTSGELSVMMNAITAAQHKHTFIYRGWEVDSDGNPYAHAILRGYQDATGKPVSNYHYENLLKLLEMYKEKNLPNPAVIVDANHENSGKHCVEQIRITRDILYSRRQNEEIKKMVKGIMIESYLVEGAQKTDGTVYGQSITDPCLGWEKTEALIYEIADTLNK